MMTWPYTPGINRYKCAAAVNDDPGDPADLDLYTILTDLHNLNILVQGANTYLVVQKLEELLTFTGSRSVLDIILEATDELDLENTIGFVIITPVEDSLQDLMNANQPAYQPPADLVFQKSTLVVTTLPRHPAWMGVSRPLCLIKGLEALVFEDLNKPGIPKTVIACTKADSPPLKGTPIPFPPGQPTTLRDLLTWHGATPTWFEASRAETDPHQPPPPPTTKPPLHPSDNPAGPPGILPSVQPKPKSKRSPRFRSPKPMLPDHYTPEQIEDMMAWPNTPGLDAFAWASEEYDSLITNYECCPGPLETQIPFDQFSEGRHFLQIVYEEGEIIEAEHNFTALLKKPRGRSIPELALAAMNEFVYDECIPICLALPMETTEPNPQHRKGASISFPKRLRTQQTDIGFAQLSRNPRWMGFSQALPSLRSLTALVIQDPANPTIPRAVVACPSRSIQHTAPKARNFPDGTPRVLKDLLTWHGALPAVGHNRRPPRTHGPCLDHKFHTTAST